VRRRRTEALERKENERERSASKSRPSSNRSVFRRPSQTHESIIRRRRKRRICANDEPKSARVSSTDTTTSSLVASPLSPLPPRSNSPPTPTSTTPSPIVFKNSSCGKLVPSHVIAFGITVVSS